MRKFFYPSSKSSVKESTPRAGDSSENSSSHSSPAFTHRPETSPAFGHPTGAFEHPGNTSTGFTAEDLYPEAAFAGHQRSMSFSSTRSYPPPHGISDDGIYVAQPRPSRSLPTAAQPAAPPQAPPFSIPRQQQQQQKQEHASGPPQANLEKELSRDPDRGGSSNGGAYSRQSNGSMQSAPAPAQSFPPRPVRVRSDALNHDRASAEAFVEKVSAKQSAHSQEDPLSNAVPSRSSAQLGEDLLTNAERASAYVKPEADLLSKMAAGKSAGEGGQKCGHCGSNLGPDGQAIDDSWADDVMATAGALFFCGWIKKMSARAGSNALNSKGGGGLQGGFGNFPSVQKENAGEGVATGKAHPQKQTPAPTPPARRQSRPRRESIDLNPEINVVQAEEALYRLVPSLYRHWQAGELAPPQAAPSTTPEPPTWPATADPFDEPESFGGSPFSAAKHQSSASAKQTPNAAVSQDTPTPPASRRSSQAESAKPGAGQPGEDSLSPSEFEELMKQYGPELQAAGLTGQQQAAESQRRPSFSSSPLRTAPAKAQDNSSRSDPRAPETPDQKPASNPSPPAAAPRDPPPPPDPPKPAAAPAPSSAPQSRTPSPFSSPPRDVNPEATVDDLLRAFGSVLPPDHRKPPQQEVPKPAPPLYSSAYSTAYASAKREVPKAAQRPPPPPPPPPATPQGPSADPGVEDLMRGLSGTGPKGAPPGPVPASNSVPQTPKRTPETTPRPSTGADAPAGAGGSRRGSGGVSPPPAVDVDELLRQFPDAGPTQQKPTSKRTPPPPPPPQAAAPPPVRTASKDPFGDSGSPFRANSAGFGPSSRQSSGGLNEESANFFGMSRSGSSGSSTSGRAPTPPQPPPVAAGVATQAAPRIPEEQLVAYIRQWATGKEGNLRALLATLQFVLWKECRWRQVDVKNLVEGTAVKKAYQRAILCVHPDKVHGDTPEHKLIAKHVFNYLKEAYNRFSSEELF